MTASATPRKSNLRWWICLIVFFATTIIYSDRQFLSLLKSTLANEIHWTDTQCAGVNSCFLGAYAFGLLFFGRFIDKEASRSATPRPSSSGAWQRSPIPL